MPGVLNGRSVVGPARLRPVAVLGAILVLITQGCAVWSPVWLDGLPLPERVRVQERSGKRLDIEHPRLKEDSILVGTKRGTSEEVRIPVGEGTQVEGRSVSFGRTLLLVGVGGYLLVMGITIAVMPST